MKSRLKKFNFYSTEIGKMENAPEVQELMMQKAELMKTAAIAAFNSQVKHTHGITAPAYTASFKIDRYRRMAKIAISLSNTDPAAFWVEFGAYLHDPKHPRILRYAPLRKALDAVGKIT